jgi:hypothetical protein
VTRVLLALFWTTLCIAGSEAPAVEPECETVWRNLLEGDLEGAAETFAGLAAPEPVDGCAVEGRVVALIELKRWRQALDEARTFHERDDDQPRVAAALGEALYRAGRLEEARELLVSLLTTDDAPATAYALMGLLAVAEGRAEEAVEWMERAMGIDPEDRRVLYRASEAAASRAESLRRLQRYLDLSEGDDPDRVEGARGRVRMLEALGDRPVWVSETTPDRVEVPLQLVPLPGGRLLGAVVKVRVGEKGKPVRLMLDSGSSGVFLVERMARKRGFEAIALETAFGGGGDQRHASPRGIFPRFALEELSFRDAMASTTRVEFDPTGRFHGVLGLSRFDRWRSLLVGRRPDAGPCRIAGRATRPVPLRHRRDDEHPRPGLRRAGRGRRAARGSHSRGLRGGLRAGLRGAWHEAALRGLR